jgi:hypothetical protein
MLKTYWNYIDNYGQIIDIEKDTEQEAIEYAKNQLAEDCINYGVGYEMIEIVIQSFFFDNDNNKVVIRKKPCIIIYDVVKEEITEHFNKGL